VSALLSSFVADKEKAEAAKAALAAVRTARAAERAADAAEAAAAEAAETEADETVAAARAAEAALAGMANPLCPPGWADSRRAPAFRPRAALAPPTPVPPPPGLAPAGSDQARPPAAPAFFSSHAPQTTGAQEALLGGWLLSRSASLADPTVCRYLWALCAAPSCEPLARSAAAAALLAAAAAAGAGPEALRCAVGLARPGPPPPASGPPPGWLPGAEDFLAALEAGGLRCLAAQSAAAGGGEEPPAPPPASLPLLLSLLPACLAGRAARRLPPPPPQAVASLCAALLAVGADPMGCWLARPQLAAASAALLAAVPGGEAWVEAAARAAAALAAGPGGLSPRAVAEALPAAVTGGTARGRQLRAAAALAALARLPPSLLPRAAREQAAAASLLSEGGCDGEPAAAAAAAARLAECALRLLRVARLSCSAPGQMPVDHANLVAAMRLADVALDASLEKGTRVDAGAERRVEAFRQLLGRISQQVRPSARNLAATEANGCAARLLARYVRPGRAAEEEEEDAEMELA